jgi:LysM repeat protein
MVWRLYKVQPSDTVYGVSRKFKITERALAQVNSLEGNALLADAKLVIPLSGPAPIEGKIIYAKRPTRYQVRRGDTVVSVADEFGVPPERVRHWNGLKTNQLRHGRWLVIYKPLAPGEPNPAPVRHKKKPGATAKPKPTVAKAQETKRPSNSANQ